MNTRNIILGVLLFLIIDKFIPVDPVKVSSDIARKKISMFKYDHVLDIRSSKDRSYGYHAYSLHFPIEEINNVKDKISKKNRRLLVISRNGKSAKKAANKLSFMGYRNVEYLNEVWTKII